MCICTSMCTCLINKHMYMYILGWPKSVFGFSILFWPTLCMYGLLKWLRSKESACQLGKHGFDPWGWEVPLEKEMATHSSMDRGYWRAIVHTVHGVAKSQT